MLDPQDFDQTRAVVMSRAAQVGGHQLNRGDSVAIVQDETGNRAELTAGQAAALWANGMLVYADRALATPVESPEQYAARVTEVDELDDGSFMIRAPWLGQGEPVSADKLDERKQQVIDEGAEAHRELIDNLGPQAAATILGGTDGFLLADNGNGNFEISGPGLDEPLKIRGRQKAEDKLAELRTVEAAKTEPVQPAAPVTAAVPAAQSADTTPPVTDAAPPADATVKPPVE